MPVGVTGQTPDIAALVKQLTQPPGHRVGIYRLMNGFIAKAADEAQHHARERVVDLFGSDDIRSW
jgi:hypothetical protein